MNRLTFLTPLTLAGLGGHGITSSDGRHCR
jgi:hypothetical protein